MNAAFRIRLALAADVQSIHSLDRAVASAPHWAMADYLAALSIIDHVAAPSGTSRCMFVADAASGLTGFAVGKVTVVEAEVHAELESVGVAVPSRRAGIGRALCEAVMQWSGRQGASEIELEVRSRSIGPIALYTGLGFEPMGLRKGYYRQPIDDAVLMRLTLRPNAAMKARFDRDL